MAEMTPDDVRRVRSAFIFRMGYVAVLWLGCALLLHRFGLQGLTLTIVVLALPIAIALIAPMDWRWLNKHPRSVNRFGLRMGARE
ncbi:hypothetical protein [Aliiroseovarius subalbicans]|uniref:hypothetical protein n=1 Tax=Aliiroseovarius subalbicans TaxID=2925840 RepID=UPI001F568EB0|nr:hypothetical protein [Aliiroseovarius subalbicans]MCI2399935.1 hypothetical protein [Aliiroseovarius subalbicans]